jgi:hypothetical protein
MATIREIYQSKKEKLQSGLSACNDITAAADEAMAFMDSLAQSYIAQEPNALLRQEAARSLTFGKAVLACLYSASKVKMLAVPEKTHQTDTALDLSTLRRYSPSILSLLLTAALLAGGNFWLILLSAAASAACVWQNLQRAAKNGYTQLKAQGIVQVNVPELCEKLEYICVLADRNISSLTADSAEDETIVWTQLQYQAVQALWEAVHAQDGDFALKSIAPLLEELQRQGVEIITANPENRQYFDCLPGFEKDGTVRPAMKKGNRLLARGQATTGM